MKALIRLRYFTLLLLLVPRLLFAQAAVPALTGPITDLTASLSREQHAELDRTLRAFEREKGSQLAVLIVPSTQPETIEQYAIRVAEQWRLGRKGIDDGALLLVAKEDRELRIEVGYGLEGALSDVVVKRIIEEQIVPRFKSGDFYGGIAAGVSAMIQVIRGEPLPEPGQDNPSAFPLVAFFGVFIVLMIISAIMSSRAGPRVSGSRPYRSSGGGFGGGGFRSSGGYRGGGGGFGGGGASGRW